ncbi:MAG: hypothetical protein PHX87_06320 [Candidatus Peribacteraceae bacterium]|nr:hypothetical protein [Candidatus Peribacteraceae bacterium]MDD5743006.1 hypothetical protein [Candidatus Peribacteraceae bacterium]
MSGSTTFYNLTKTVAAADTLTFEAGTTQTVSNTLTLNGAASNLLSLRSTQNGSQWNIDPQATRTVSYLDVKDSNNTNGTLLACSTGCQTSENNTNWGTGTAPALSSVAAAATNTTATITWTSDPAGSSRVEFGPMGSYGALTPETDTSLRVTSHSVALSNLLPCAFYHYRALSKDTWQVQGVSADRTFQTTGCAASADITAQTGATVSSTATGSVALTGTNTGITLTIPPGSTSQSTVTFQINQLPPTTVLASIGGPSGMSVVGNVYQLVAILGSTGSVTSFSQPLTVAIQYSSSEVSGLDEATLQIYRHDGSAWSALTGCTVNSGTKTVTCTTTQFSTFGLFGSSASTVAGGGAARTRELLQELGFIAPDDEGQEGGAAAGQEVTEPGTQESAEQAATPEEPTVVHIEIAPPLEEEPSASSVTSSVSTAPAPSLPSEPSTKEGVSSSVAPEDYREGVVLPSPPERAAASADHEEQVREVREDIRETLNRAASAPAAAGRALLQNAEKAAGALTDGARYMGGQIADGARYMGGQIADGARIAGGQAAQAGLKAMESVQRTSRRTVAAFRDFGALLAMRSERIADRLNESGGTARRAVAFLVERAGNGARKGMALIAGAAETGADGIRRIVALGETGTRSALRTGRQIALSIGLSDKQSAPFPPELAQMRAEAREEIAGWLRAGATSARDTAGLVALRTEQALGRATDITARSIVAVKESFGTAHSRVSTFIARGGDALRSLRSPEILPSSEIAEKSAAPEPSARKYRTALTKRDGALLIASLNLSVMDSLGNPYRQTPVVLFSTPKIATTDDEGIATFHDVETGKHQIEIHVKEGQIEKKEIILEPPSGLTVEEQQRLDVLLPVVNVVVNEPLRGSALDIAGLPLASWIVIALVVLGNAILGLSLVLRNRARG